MSPKLGEKDLYQKGSLKKNFKPKPSRQIIGQERAVEALNFAVNLSAPNAHLVCLGPKGVGRTSLTLDILRQFAEKKAAPKDWVYVANFNDLLHPLAMALPAGQGPVFAQKMAAAVQGIQEGLKTFLSDEKYQIQLAHIKQKYAAQKQADFNQLAASVASPFTTLSKTPQGIVVSPVKDGQILTPDLFNQLPLADRKVLLAKMKAAQERLEKALTESTFDASAEGEEITCLNTKWAEKVVDKKYTPLHKNYQEMLPFLRESKKYILTHLDSLLSGNETAWRPLKVNAFVSNHPAQGAPVVLMGHISIGALLGKIEREQQAGSLISDHTLIQPGVLHQANGGFLVIEGKDLLGAASVWQALKRALYTHQIQMENPDEGVFAVKTLLPQPIPLNVKVVLVGDTGLYYTLAGKEEDFEELFKLQARFGEKMPRTPASEHAYASVLADFVERAHLLTFDASAYNRLMEFAARLAQDKQGLSTRLARVHDLMREADFVARQKETLQVGAVEVETALRQREKRQASAHEEWLETAKRGLLKFNLSGTAIGQINALVVHELGAFQFGRPSRVTCRVRLGSGNVADIEREVALGGTLHSKGVLILGAYLSAKYGQEYTLPVDASLVWEQSYSELDGDSASSAELYALMSAIGGIGLNQSIAVTGSVNQMGEIQAVGAVNEKVEGFFDACQVMGLTGKQGVLIPAVSVSNLMLAERVRQAVRKGQFHLWAVKTIEEGFELLTGLSASASDKKIREALSHYHYLAKK
ncbi:MAG: Lon protease family protein [Alphaproteobacteria bacterium]